ncbi:two-component sensor protein histidine kinase (dhkk, dhkj) (macronuclear) [Tetrahymena thermophila SB210]|uniref:Two-component sensor protein histidine kinase (Dhkk, dhkj) n=1 Tax=Tetrahymena thermophila (strain SB210) TaxID=312017 RepID=A4VEV9_TETTS|nr:two-component sensor protein histidine kinase (dhkk, dhkj) [Tetrahymena thermophila SB210]EDK32072.2 two-component sensor protein histidine kinase (dhkk, dhkj) [Tetrahymena thermophila SB210]|eukprot:XP_001471091.2 two-component sensor protein histidine kinase (dhkk, dhkj) [Tetrahymena thermophila SB210]
MTKTQIGKNNNPNLTLMKNLAHQNKKNEFQRFRTSSRIQEQQNAYYNNFQSYEEVNLQRNVFYFEDRNDLLILLQNKDDIENRIQWLKIGLYQGKKMNSKSDYYILIEYWDNTTLLKNISQNEIFEYKNRMLASISHELRTPLNCSIQMLNLLIKNFEEEKFDTQEIIEMLIKPALNSNYILLNIINDILDYAQINTGDFQLTFTRLSLFELVTECIEMVCYQAALKGIQIECSFDTNLPEYIHSDYNRIRIFFTLESPKLIRVDVSDTGCGIPEANIKEIFEAFGNKLNSKYLNTKGAGFGLSITNNLAMGLGGNRKMIVKSKINEGSTFSFYIIDRDFDKSGCKYKLKDVFNQQIIKWETCTKIESKSNFVNTGSRQNILNIMKSYHISSDYSKQVPEFNQSNSFIFDNSQFDPLENQTYKQYGKQSTITLSLMPKKVQTNSKSSHMQMSSSFNNNTNNQSQTEGSFYKQKYKNNQQETCNYSNQKLQEQNAEQSFLIYSKEDKNSLAIQQSFLVMENQLDKKIESSQIIEENSCLNFNTNSTNNLQLRKPYFQECDPTSPILYPLQNQILYEQSGNGSIFSQIKGKKHNQIQKTIMLQEMKAYNLSKNKQENEQSLSTISEKLNKQNAEKICECNQILIVDDNDFNLYSLQLILKTYGFVVDKSNSGMDAISKVKLKYSNQSCCQYYKVIFMDIDMPIMDGHQTTTEIIKFYLDQKSSFKPVISACSAYVQDSEKQKAFQKGMKYYITKPINIKQLEQILAKEFLNENRYIK